MEHLIDNIFVGFGGRIFRQTVGIPIETNCAPLLADLFSYSYGAEFIQGLMKAGEKRLAQQFNFTYRCKDDILSLNKSKFSANLEFIYPRYFEIKETSVTTASYSFLPLYRQ